MQTASEMGYRDMGNVLIALQDYATISFISTFFSSFSSALAQRRLEEEGLQKIYNALCLAREKLDNRRNNFTELDMITIVVNANLSNKEHAAVFQNGHLMANIFTEQNHPIPRTRADLFSQQHISRVTEIFAESFLCELNTANFAEEPGTADFATAPAA